MKKKLIIGIDPGKSGGVCFIEGKKMNFVKYPPLGPLSLEIIFDDYLSKYSADSIYCAIEQVWAFPGDSGKAAFSFGFNYGVWNSVLERNEIYYD